MGKNLTDRDLRVIHDESDFRPCSCRVDIHASVDQRLGEVSSEILNRSKLWQKNRVSFSKLNFTS